MDVDERKGANSGALGGAGEEVGDGGVCDTGEDGDGAEGLLLCREPNSVALKLEGGGGVGRDFLKEN